MSKQLTIGDIMERLSAFPDTARVVFDFDIYGVAPKYGHSWRGVYSEPAIGYGYGDCRISRLREELNRLVSEEFHGWKGGTYRFTADQILRVDNTGECRGISIVGVRRKESLDRDGVVAVTAILDTEIDR